MEDTGRKERLRVLLKEAGLTQDQLARETGICEKTLRNFMGGRNMGSDSLIHISKRLDASTDFLLGLSKRRHNKGRWIDPAAENCYRCSVCEEYTTMEIPRLLYHYCPNCGAKMEGAEE